MKGGIPRCRSGPFEGGPAPSSLQRRPPYYRQTVPTIHRDPVQCSAHSILHTHCCGVRTRAHRTVTRGGKQHLRAHSRNHSHIETRITVDHTVRTSSLYSGTVPIRLEMRACERLRMSMISEALRTADLMAHSTPKHQSILTARADAIVTTSGPNRLAALATQALSRPRPWHEGGGSLSAVGAIERRGFGWHSVLGIIERRLRSAAIRGSLVSSDCGHRGG